MDLVTLVNLELGPMQPVEKAFSPGKVLARVKGLPAASRAKNYRRGFNQQMLAHGEPPISGLGREEIRPSILATKRGHQAFVGGQAAGREHITYNRRPDQAPPRTW